MLADDNDSNTFVDCLSIDEDLPSMGSVKKYKIDDSFQSREDRSEGYGEAYFITGEPSLLDCNLSRAELNSKRGTSQLMKPNQKIPYHSECCNKQSNKQNKYPWKRMNFWNDRFDGQEILNDKIENNYTRCGVPRLN